MQQVDDFSELSQWYGVPVVVIVGNIIAYIFCQFVKDNSWIDVFWSLTFLTPLIYIVVIQLMNDTPIYARKIINIVLIFIWAIRLSAHIGIRHKCEDFRYAQWRKEWNEKGKCYYYTVSFLMIFILQGIASIIFQSTSMYTMILTDSNDLYWTDYLGILIWLIGFIFEAVGDA